MGNSVLFSIPNNTAADSINLAILQPNQQVVGFYTEAVYSTDAQDTLGARFIHKKSGFVLDLLRIQTIPQAFIWVNTHPVSDRGEPHTLEHLLLGKGEKRALCCLSGRDVTGQELRFYCPGPPLLPFSYYCWEFCFLLSF